MYLLIFFIYVLFLGIVYYALRRKDCHLAFYILALFCAMGILKFSIFTYLYFVENKNICDSMNKMMECNKKED